MTLKREISHRRPDTRFSKDGCTVFVRLRVDRRDYEFARQWAAMHAEADPSGTAEDQLEGYLNMALLSHIADADWSAPPEIGALYPEDAKKGFPTEVDEDEVPF